jgi:hypothetical protein
MVHCCVTADSIFMAPGPAATKPGGVPPGWNFKLLGLRGAVYRGAAHVFDFAPAALPPEAVAAAAAAGADVAAEAADPIGASAGRWLSRHLTPKLDAWGLGALLAQVALGARLATGAGAPDAVPWRAHPGWGTLAPELRAVVEALTVEDPAARATVAEALAMPFATMRLGGGGCSSSPTAATPAAEKEQEQAGAGQTAACKAAADAAGSTAPRQPGTPPASEAGGGARQAGRSESGESDAAEAGPSGAAEGSALKAVSAAAGACPPAEYCNAAAQTEVAAGLAAGAGKAGASGNIGQRRGALARGAHRAAKRGCALAAALGARLAAPFAPCFAAPADR